MRFKAETELNNKNEEMTNNTYTSRLLSHVRCGAAGRKKELSRKKLMDFFLRGFQCGEENDLTLSLSYL